MCTPRGAQLIKRTTSTAAGVEKVSRHREQNQQPPSIQV